MADNPKSLASLADDLEALAKRIQTGLPNARCGPLLPSSRRASSPDDSG